MMIKVAVTVHDIQINLSTMQVSTNEESREASESLLPQVDPKLNVKSSSQTQLGTKTVLTMVAHIAALLFCAYIIYIAVPGSSKL